MQRAWDRREPGCKAAGGGRERSLLWALQGRGLCIVVKHPYPHLCWAAPGTGTPLLSQERGEYLRFSFEL